MRVPSIPASLALAVAMAAGACARPAATTTVTPPTPPRLVLEPQRSGTTALLQAVSAIDERVAWVSGHRGTWARTVDGGASWTTGRVPGADTLQFRDVQAVSADTAFLLSAGTGDLSRVYATTDGGGSWTLLHTNPDPAGFYDCMAFWDAEGGVLYGDSVDGGLVVRVTDDGGRSWKRPAGLPPAQPGEGGFAASGTCVMTMTALGLDRAWIGTGNGAGARVLRTDDRGQSWTVAAVPVATGEASGVTGISFRDAFVGVAVGGEIGKRDGRGDYVALTADGGASWTVGGRPTFAGSAYGVAYVPRASVPTVVMVGPGGADVSHDNGVSWKRLDGSAYWSLGFGSPTAGWLVGPGGRIVHVRLE